MSSRRFADSVLGVAALIMTRIAGAQSTETLGRYERAVQVQLSAATNSVFVGSQYGNQTGTLRALDVAAHFRTEGSMLVRLDAWAINRVPRVDTPNSDRLNESLAFAVIASGEFPIRLPEDVSITPEAGLGWVPRARGRFVSRDAPTRTSTGWVYSVGLALRWRYFVIEQHLLQISDADRALTNGETAPLSFGVRF